MNVRMVCVVGVLAAPALAQEIPPPGRGWSLQFEPSVSFGAAGGDVKLPGLPAGMKETKIEDLNLDGPRPAASGELILTSDPWKFMVGGYHLDTGDHDQIAGAAGQMGAVPFAIGDRLTSSLRFTAVEAAVMRRVELPGSLATGDSNFRARLDVLGGLRVYDAAFDFSAPGGTASGSGFFGHPMIGVKLTMEVIEQFTVDAQVDLGAMTTGSDSLTYGYDILAGFMWHPTQTVGVQIGYRHLAFLLRKGPEGDRFEYHGAIQGLYAGAVIHF